MKKLIGYLLSHACFCIGDWICKVSYIKRNGEYLFDRPKLMNTGMWLCRQYRGFMHYSIRMQDWAGNKTPWKTVSNEL